MDPEHDMVIAFFYLFVYFFILIFFFYLLICDSVFVRINICRPVAHKTNKRDAEIFGSLNSKIWRRPDSSNKRDASHGTSVNDASKLIRVEMITTTVNSRRILDTSSFVKLIGKNTTTITRVMDVTVKPISLTPSKAARTRFLPISICR